MTVSVKPTFKANMSRTVSNEGAADYVVSYNDYDRTTGEFNASSTPPVTDCAAGDVTPGSGTSTLDLTAIADEPTATTRDFTGIKVVYARFRAPSTNGADITIQDGSTNAYQLNGGDTIVLPPGGQFEFVFNDGLVDVSSSVKNIDIVGTNAGDECEFAFAAG